MPVPLDITRYRFWGCLLCTYVIEGNDYNEEARGFLTSFRYWHLALFCFAMMWVRDMDAAGFFWSGCAFEMWISRWFLWIRQVYRPIKDAKKDSTQNFLFKGEKWFPCQWSFIIHSAWCQSGEVWTLKEISPFILGPWVREVPNGGSWIPLLILLIIIRRRRPARWHRLSMYRYT